MSWIVLCGLALLPLVALAAEPPPLADTRWEDQPQELVRHNVWSPTNPLMPQFLSVVTLREDGIRGLSVESGVVESLEWYLEYLRSEKASNTSLKCNWSSENGFADHENPDGRTMVDVLSPQSIVALGRVRAVVPGWAISLAVTMVYVEIEEILHCNPRGAGRTVTLGSIVAGTVEVGGFELDGLTVCTRAPEHFIMPDVGDEVILGGIIRPDDPYFLGLNVPIFPVQDDAVLPQPYSNFRWDTVSLEELRNAFNGPHATCVESP